MAAVDETAQLFLVMAVLERRFHRHASVADELREAAVHGLHPLLAARLHGRSDLVGLPVADERADGVHLSYDRMVSLLRPYGNAEALQVAKDLDAKVETLLASASAAA